MTRFGEEDAAHDLRVVDGTERVRLSGRTVGGTGRHEVAIDGRLVAVIEQLAELSPDLIESIRAAGDSTLAPDDEALAREIFRARNGLSEGVIRLVYPVL